MSSRRVSISRPARARRGRRKHVRQAAGRLQVDTQSARHRIPDARRPGEAGSRLGARMAAEEGLRGDSRRQPRAAALRPARRPAVRQRRHPYRHAVNKILKDIVVKSKQLAGYDAPYVPGWDCHGMPIEVQIEKTYGKNIPVEETQRLARAYATEQIARQKAQFQRLGVLGDWDHPYTTMAFRNEADEIRMLGAILAKGYIYRGLKPVNWCFDCQSALAEAEVEYEDRTDSAIDAGFDIDPRDRVRLARAFGLETLPDGPARAVIWTTTPWTIPANQAL